MYGWGAGSQGQLGLGCSADDVISPKKISWFSRKPDRVSCGGNHAVTVTGEPVLLPLSTANREAEYVPGQAAKSACGGCANAQCQKMTPVILT